MIQIMRLRLVDAIDFRPCRHDRSSLADGLTRHYGERVTVNQIYFSISYVEVFRFLGPNGAGKRTTVRMLNFPQRGLSWFPPVKLSLSVPCWL